MFKKKKLKVYVACALTHASREYKESIVAFKKVLTDTGWIEVLEFVDLRTARIHPSKAAEHIYYTDIHECVRKSDAVVGELSLPSTGLGYELGTNIEKHRRKTIMIARKHETVAVSHLPQGAADLNSHAVFYWYYSSLDEIVVTITRELYPLYVRKNQWLITRATIWLFNFLTSIDYPKQKAAH